MADDNFQTNMDGESDESKAARLRELRSKYGVARLSHAKAPTARAQTPPLSRPSTTRASSLKWTLIPSSADANATVTSHRSKRTYMRLQQIGQGRFGSVFLCQEPHTGRVLVLKTVHSKNVNAPARVEARAMLKLRKHPNIIELHDLFEDGLEKLALVMEYADGGDLAGRIAAARDYRVSGGARNSLDGSQANGGDLHFAEALHIFVQVALALQHCHRHAVLHRDVKPANIFLTLQGVVRLGDFGIARDFHYASALDLGASFGIAGTPLYMAPEILKGEAASKPADAWALGAVLWEMVSSDLEPPFHAKCLPVLVRAIVLQPTPALEAHDPLLPDDTLTMLRALLEGLLMKSPSERWTTDGILGGPLCRPHMAHYKPSRLRKSLASETRLHGMMDLWSVEGKGGRPRESQALKPEADPAVRQRWRYGRIKATATTAFAKSSGRGTPLPDAISAASVSMRMDQESTGGGGSDAGGSVPRPTQPARISEEEEDEVEKTPVPVPLPLPVPVPVPVPVRIPD